MIGLIYSATLGVLALVFIRRQRLQIPTVLGVVIALGLAGIGIALMRRLSDNHIVGVSTSIWGASLIGGSAFYLVALAVDRSNSPQKHAWWKAVGLTPALAFLAVPSTLALALPLVALLWSTALRDAIGSGRSSTSI